MTSCVRSCVRLCVLQTECSDRREKKGTARTTRALPGRTGPSRPYHCSISLNYFMISRDFNHFYRSTLQIFTMSVLNVSPGLVISLKPCGRSPGEFGSWGPGHTLSCWPTSEILRGTQLGTTPRTESTLTACAKSRMRQNHNETQATIINHLHFAIPCNDYEYISTIW